VSRRWFIDTGFVIAMASSRDAFHEPAHHLSTRIESESIALVTSDAILLEIGAALSRLAVEILDSLRRDPNVEIVPLDRTLMDSAIVLFATRTDKEWSLADCVSFEIMRLHDLNEALSADGHFEQAGFAALLRKH
jgi:uncharacterized protein